MIVPGRKIIALILCISLISFSTVTFFYLSRDGGINNSEGDSLDEIYWPTPDQAVDIGWKPDGSYALIVLKNMLLKMNEIYNSNDVTFSVLSQDWYEFEAMSWKPDGSYALMVGGGKNIYKYDEIEINNQSYTLNSKSHQRFNDVSWKTDGEYALLVGSYWKESDLQNGLALKYDGVNFEYIEYDSDINCSFESVVWKNDGSYALIVDSYGSILKFDGTSITKLYHNNGIRLYGASWRNDGSYALIVGNSSNGQGLILKYDGGATIDIPINCFYNGRQIFREVAWKPDDNYALIGGEHEGLGCLLKYDGVDFVNLASNNDEIVSLDKIVWNDDNAIIIGELGVGFGRGSILVKFDGTQTTIIVTGMPSIIYDIAWKPDGSYLLALARAYGRPICPSLLWKYDGNNFTMIPWIIEGFGLSSNYLSGHGELTRIAWKPDGTYALIVGHDVIVQYDGNHLEKKVNQVAMFWDIEWKPDGSYALVVDRRGLVYKFDGLCLTELYRTDDIELTGVSWKSDGSEAIISGEDGLLHKFNENTFSTIEAPKHFLNGQPMGDIWLWDVDWNPKKDEALVVGNGGCVYMFENNTLTTLEDYYTMNGTFGLLLDYVVYNSEGTYAIILGTPILYDGNNLTVIRDDPIQGGVAWYPDGSYALIASIQDHKIYKYVPGS